jgi:hypothetical protein
MFKEKIITLPLSDGHALLYLCELLQVEWSIIWTTGYLFFKYLFYRMCSQYNNCHVASASTDAYPSIAGGCNRASGSYIGAWATRRREVVGKFVLMLNNELG